MNKETWVLVANKEKARIFEVEKMGHLREIQTLIHPEAGLKASDLYSDTLGRSTEAFRQGQHQMEPVTPLKLKEALIFARQIAKYLKEQQTASKFNRLFLMAEPSFLGVLREELPKNVCQCIDTEIAKDLTKLDAKGIWDYIP